MDMRGPTARHHSRPHIRARAVGVFREPIAEYPSTSKMRISVSRSPAGMPRGDVPCAGL